MKYQQEVEFELNIDGDDNDDDVTYFSRKDRVAGSVQRSNGVFSFLFLMSTLALASISKQAICIPVSSFTRGIPSRRASWKRHGRMSF